MVVVGGKLGGEVGMIAEEQRAAYVGNSQKMWEREGSVRRFPRASEAQSWEGK